MSDADRFANDVTEEGKPVGPCTIPENTTKIDAKRLADYQSNCDRYKSRADAGDSAQTIAIVSTIVGGAAIVGTVVYYFIDRGPEKSASARSTPPMQVRFTPWVGSGQAGLGVSGTF
jgi:hypothetical protein